MSIETAFNAITPYHENSYKIFNDILEKAEPQISFWRDHYVTNPAYEGKLKYSKVCDKVQELVDSNPEFSLEERIIGLKIQAKVDLLGSQSSKITDSIPRIRQIFLDIFYFFHSFIFDDYDGECETEDPFNYCTLNQYRDIVGEDPKGECDSYFRDDSPETEIKVWALPSKKLEELEGK